MPADSRAMSSELLTRHVWRWLDPDTGEGYCAKCEEQVQGKRQRGTWRCPNKNRDVRSEQLKVRYGISTDDYEAMLAKQRGACAICKSTSEALHVDHDHATGKVRGLLCGSCNRGIGCLGDDVVTLKAAVRYLQSHA